MALFPDETGYLSDLSGEMAFHPDDLQILVNSSGNSTGFPDGCDSLIRKYLSPVRSQFGIYSKYSKSAKPFPEGDCIHSPVITPVKPPTVSLLM